MPLLGGVAVSLCSTQLVLLRHEHFDVVWRARRANEIRARDGSIWLLQPCGEGQQRAPRTQVRTALPKATQAAWLQLEESERLQYVVLDDPPPGYASLHDDVSLPEATPATPERQ